MTSFAPLQLQAAEREKGETQSASVKDNCAWVGVCIVMGWLTQFGADGESNRSYEPPNKYFHPITDDLLRGWRCVWRAFKGKFPLLLHSRIIIITEDKENKCFLAKIIKLEWFASQENKFLPIKHFEGRIAQKKKISEKKFSNIKIVTQFIWMKFSRSHKTRLRPSHPTPSISCHRLSYRFYIRHSPRHGALMP